MGNRCLRHLWPCPMPSSTAPSCFASLLRLDKALELGACLGAAPKCRANEWEGKENTSAGCFIRLLFYLLPTHAPLVQRLDIQRDVSVWLWTVLLFHVTRRALRGVGRPQLGLLSALGTYNREGVERRLPEQPRHWSIKPPTASPSTCYETKRTLCSAGCPLARGCILLLFFVLGAIHGLQKVGHLLRLCLFPVWEIE